MDSTPRLRLAATLATLAVCAATRSARTAALEQQQRHVFSASACLRRGLTLADGRARLCERAFVPDGQGRIWFEAEAAVDMRPATARVTGDSTHSCGAYLLEPDTAAYTFVTVTSGQHSIWARVHWRGPAANSHYIAVDGGPATVLGNMEDPSCFGRWFWVEGPQVDLGTGVHQVLVTRREREAALDCFVVAPAGFVPNGIAEVRSRVQPCVLGVLETPDFRPPAVTHWDRVDLDAAGAGEDIRVQLSTDGGGTWQAAPEGGVLHSVPVKGDGSDRLRIRAVITRRDDGIGPEVASIALGCSLRPGSLLTLENEHTRISFDAAKGTVWQLVNRATGVSCISVAKATVPVALFAFDRKGKAPVPLPSPALVDARVERTNDVQSAVLLYRVPGMDVDARCSVQVRDGDPVTTWQVSVRNGSQQALVEQVFPILPVRLGDPADDILILPHEQGGERIVSPTLGAPLRSYRYPGDACMQWLDLHDDTNGGVYLASYDQSGLYTGIEAETAEPGILQLRMRKYAYIAPGEEWASAPFAVAMHAGDWHWAADRYREWAEGWMRRPQTPAWLRDSDGWVINSIRDRFEQALPQAYRRAVASGLGHVQSWGQMMPGLPFAHTNCSRFPLPDPLLGTEQQFRDAIRSVHALGGKAGFYINGWAWNPRYPRLNPRHEGLVPESVAVPDWDAGFKHNAVTLYAGTWKPWYDKPADDPSAFPCAFYSMCPASKGWQEHLRHWVVDKYAVEYEADGMYLDCVARTGTYCFDRAHGHRHHGDCNFLQILPQLKNDAVQARGEFFLGTEGCCDVYGQWVDIHLICAAAALRGWSSGVWPEVFRYTFPDYLLYDGFANGACGATPEKILCGVFLLGTRFDGVRTDELGQQVLALRRRISDVLDSARFMDTVGLTVSHPGVAAKWFRPPRGDVAEALLTVWNPDCRAEQWVSLDLPAGRDCSYCYVYPLGGPPSTQSWQSRDGRVKLLLPATRLAALVLTREPRAVLEVGNPTRTFPGRTSELVVTAASPAAVPVTVKVSVDRPPAWSVTGPSEIRVATAGDMSVRYALACPSDGVAGDVPLAVHLDLPQGTRTVRRLVTVAPATELGNLLTNGTCEVVAGWMLDGAEGGVAAYDADIAHQGRQSLRLSHADGSRRVMARQRVDAAELKGKRLRLTAWCRPRGVRPTADGKGATIRVILYRNASTAAAPWVFTPAVTGTADWHEVDSEFHVPADTQWLDVELFLWHAQGCVWWDDIRLGSL